MHFILLYRYQATSPDVGLEEANESGGDEYQHLHSQPHSGWRIELSLMELRLSEVD
jgi:hypothetical protein